MRNAALKAPIRIQGRARQGTWGRCFDVLVILAIATLLISSASMANDQVAREQVEGRGVILHSDQAAARKRALRASMRLAVEQALATVLDAQLLIANIKVLEQEVYRKSQRYIRNYRVLWEYPDLIQQVYRIGIEAEVAVGELTQAVAQLGLTPSGRPILRVLVLVSEGPETEARFVGQATRVMTRVLRREFEANQFRVVEPDPSVPWDGEEASALAVGRAADASIVLVGWASVRQTHDGVAGMAVQTVQAESQLRVWIPQTGIQLAYKQAKISVDHADTFLAGRQALEKIAADLAVQLLPDLQTYRQRDATQTGEHSRRF